MKFSHNTAVEYLTTKINMWKPSLTPVELFRIDKLDKDFQRIVQPFNIMLSVFFSSKYKIKNSYITRCDKKYPILMFSIISFCNMFSAYNFFTDSKDTHKVYALFLICFTVYCIDYVLLITYNITNSRSNISLILNIQEIHRSIGNSKSVRNYIIWNWIILMSMITVFVSAVSSFVILNPNTTFVDLSNGLMLFEIELNLMYGIRLMTLLTMYLKEWVKILLHIDGENNEFSEKLIKIYDKILEAYSLYKTCFRIFVSRWMQLFGVFYV